MASTSRLGNARIKGVDSREAVGQGETVHAGVRAASVFAMLAGRIINDSPQQSILRRRAAKGQGLGDEQKSIHECP